MSVDPRLSAGHCAKRAACLTSPSCEPWELRVGLPAYSAETGSPRSHRQESAPAVRTQASPTPEGCVCPFLYLVSHSECALHLWGFSIGFTSSRVSFHSRCAEGTIVPCSTKKLKARPHSSDSHHLDSRQELLIFGGSSKRNETATFAQSG